MRRAGELQEIRVDDLLSWPRNYREHPPDQVERIARSLKQHGLYRNCVVQAGTNRIITECLAKSDSKLEGQAFNKKKDLFEKIFGEKLVLLWKKQ